MKYDPETTTVEFTVRVPVGAIAATHDYVEAEGAAVPVAALMHLLDTHIEQVSVLRIMGIIKDHASFEDSLASHGLFIAAERARELAGLRLRL